jgi:DNA polymerase III subunit alpha
LNVLTFRYHSVIITVHILLAIKGVICFMCFVHLHNHSSFSLRDAYSSIPGMVRKAKQNGQPALALTDHGVLHGIPEFVRECKKEGIKPIVGCELYFTPMGRDNKEKDPDTGKIYYHLLALAINKEGYHNLLKLCSLGHTEGFYRRPRIDWELLEKYHEGIIFTSTCLGGYIPQLLLNGKEEKAKEIANRFKNLLGDRFYFEIQPHEIPQQVYVNKELVYLSEELSIPLLATTDAHYSEEDECIPHMGMLKMSSGYGKQIGDLTQDPKHPYGGNYFYLKTEQEVVEDFRKQELPEKAIKEAVENTVKVSELVNFELKKEGVYLPKISEDDSGDKLIDMISEGLIRKVKFKNQKEKQMYLERVKYEYSIIKQKGFEDYFLVVADAIKNAREKGILAGFPGRGSGGGCLIAYLLDIVEIDPMRFGLFFERFLDVTREKLPDIDTDVEDSRRYELINYLKEKYGVNKVSQIANYGYMKPKLALKNALSVYDIPFAEAKKYSKLIPDDCKDLRNELESNEELKEALNKSLKNENGNTVKFDQIFDLAIRFQGRIDKIGKHAGGILITPFPIMEHFPVMVGNDGLQTQWDKDDVESLGGVKFDFLGLSNLSKVAKTLQKIKQRHGYDLDIYKISRTLDDPKVYKTLNTRSTKDIFQMGGKGAVDLIKQIKPSHIEHLIAINALNRPAALSTGQHLEYIRRKNDPSLVTYDHPDEEKALKENYGLMLYQEDTMKLAKIFAGWSYGKSDKLRKMSKWSEEEIKQWETDFIQDAIKKGYDEETARTIWDKIYGFNIGGYGFNKSHAAAYSVLGYVNLWLKTYFPKEWLAACLESDYTRKNGSQEEDNFQKNIEAAIDMRVDILPPDVNKSTDQFEATDKGILIALQSLTNVGEKPAKEIIANRPYESLENFLSKVDQRIVSKRVMESLILSGAFDETHPELTRAQLMKKYLELKNGKTLEEEQGKQLKKPTKSGKAFINEILSYIEAEQEQGEELFNYKNEIKYFGYALKSNPLKRYGYKPFEERAEDETAYVNGLIHSVREIKDRRGKPMAFVTIQTLKERVNAVFFSNQWAKFKDELNKSKCFMFIGTKSKDNLLVNKIKTLGA